MKGQAPAGLARTRHPVRIAAFALVCTLLAGAGWYGWERSVQLALDASTGPGATRVITLPDGSRVALNRDSVLQLRYHPRRRVMTLERGEAFFDVVRDPDRPFTLASGPSALRVDGAAFNVRVTPSRLVIKVLDGQVELWADRAAQPDQMLRLGPESGVAIERASGAYHSVIANAEAIGDWRTGQVRFSRWSLAEVAEELARYLGQPVTLASPELAPLLVSGTLATDAPEHFLQTLPERMAVQVQQQTDGSWHITAGR